MSLAHEPAPSPPSPSSFVILLTELKRRTQRPAGETVFWAYLLVGIIAFGGCGIILEVFKALLADQGRDWGSLYTALLTYSPAVAGPALLQIAFEIPQNRRLGAFVVVSGLTTLAVLIVTCP